MLGSDKSVEAAAHRKRVIDGLAFNAREDHRPQDAERLYRSTIDELPAAEAAYFHFQLGRHYELAGRPHNALRELQTAARLSPAQFAGPVEALIDSMRLHSPACVIAPPVVLEDRAFPKRPNELFAIAYSSSNLRAVAKTASNIGSVKRPVNVFC